MSIWKHCTEYKHPIGSINLPHLLSGHLFHSVINSRIVCGHRGAEVLKLASCWLENSSYYTINKYLEHTLVFLITTIAIKMVNFWNKDILIRILTIFSGYIVTQVACFDNNSLGSRFGFFLRKLFSLPIFQNIKITNSKRTNQPF